MNVAEQLKSDIEQELSWDPSVRAEKIGVSVNDGAVELNGHVGSYYEKWAAERAALRVAQVKSVASEIEVDLPLDCTRPDAELAEAVADHLQWSYLVPSTVKAIVSDGWVTLQGVVHAQFQRKEAENAVRPLMGVKGVINGITLAHRVLASDVRQKIESALRRDAQIDATGITVGISDNKVTLRGSVRSWLQRDNAETAAFAAPGVTNVENLITIH